MKRVVILIQNRAISFPKKETFLVTPESSQKAISGKSRPWRSIFARAHPIHNIPVVNTIATK
ncbi:hypothetical protein [Agriterribacter sp.]|uniref:hypothetical protein n=1 Tax=Agriterribacter sp. TaxID=2821509 RepID=UPI002B60505C|nr:hypothetical protein [Agriterribacter sp.]HRO45399.1 hypothetical protein [Agriterribacter sp.]